MPPGTLAPVLQRLKKTRRDAVIGNGRVVRSSPVGRAPRALIATPQSATVITLDINHLDVNDVRLNPKLRNRRVRVCPRFVRIAQNGQVA
jgi:hypothetical protein